MILLIIAMSNLADISLFLRVLDLKSISAAARSLDISPALASKRLQVLEQQLGVRLLHRTTRTVSATVEGRELALRGRHLVEELATLTSDLKKVSQEVSGTLRITAGVSFGRLFISPLLPQFLKQHPALKVQLNLSDERVNLVDSGFDLAIRISSALEDSSLLAKKLNTNKRILCASADYLANFGQPNSPADLAQHNCLILSGEYGREHIWQLMNKQGLEEKIKVQGTLESNLGEALYQAALSGLGISLHSDWHIKNDLEAGRLCHVLPDYYKQTSIYAVMPQRQFVPLRVRAFIQFIEQQLAAPIEK
ncbi:MULTISPECIES: LysR family transcriptional regulator [unclassified Agarivorans]|uniref:LysR family transcriptional regulator n=1 Tax=unclassified Agarivorans TaxID=2636026 RepID=UPI003D7C42B2